MFQLELYVSVANCYVIFSWLIEIWNSFGSCSNWVFKKLTYIKFHQNERIFVIDNIKLIIYNVQFFGTNYLEIHLRNLTLKLTVFLDWTQMLNNYPMIRKYEAFSNQTNSEATHMCQFLVGRWGDLVPSYNSLQSTELLPHSDN